MPLKLLRADPLSEGTVQGLFTIVEGLSETIRSMSETKCGRSTMTQYTNLTVAKFGAACDSKAGLSKCAITSGTLKFS